MHPSVMEYVGGQVAVYGLNQPGSTILEVGSFDENGSVRQHFAGCSYCGVDVRVGPGVDKVCDGNSLTFPGGTFNVVISTEMLEHDRFPWRSINEMSRVVRDHGTLIVTARGYDERGCYPPHGVNEHGDYWRFSVEGLSSVVQSAGFTILDARSDPEEVGVFITARKETT